MAMQWAFAAASSLGLLALAASGLLTLQVLEHRRFVRSRCRRPVQNPAMPVVEIIAPCKGQEPGLDENLQALFVQAYPNYGIRFVVESAHDPAVVSIERCAKEHPRIPMQLVVAGVATDEGQKVHNLLAATNELPSHVESLVFVDSDARPAPGWLTHMVGRLRQPGVGATTGYRCFVPAENRLANLLLENINGQVASMLASKGPNLVWGGSWAILRSTFDRLQFQEAWRHTLSDDLVASRLLRRQRLKIEFVPQCMVASGADFSWANMAEFVTRQYTIVRAYLPGFWWGTFLGQTLGLLGTWGTLLASLAALATGSAWFWPLVFTFLGMYALSCARNRLRQQAAAEYLPSHAAKLQGSWQLGRWASPLCAIVHWGLVAAALFRRDICWRGIRYVMQPGGKVTRVSRPPVNSVPSPHAMAGVTSARRS